MRGFRALNYIKLSETLLLILMRQYSCNASLLFRNGKNMK